MSRATDCAVVAFTLVLGSNIAVAETGCCPRITSVISENEIIPAPYVKRMLRTVLTNSTVSEAEKFALT